MELPEKFPYHEDQIRNATDIAVSRLGKGLLVPRDAFDCLSVTHTSIETGEVKLNPIDDAIVINGLSKIFKR